MIFENLENIFANYIKISNYLYVAVKQQYYLYLVILCLNLDQPSHWLVDGWLLAHDSFRQNW